MTDSRRNVAALVVFLGSAMALGPMFLFTVSVLAPFIVEEMGLTTTQIGLLPSAFFVAASVGAPSAGGVADRFGPRAAVLGLSALAVFSFLMLSTAHVLVLMLVGALAAGYAHAISNPVTNQLVAARVPAGSRGLAMGFKQAGVPSATVLAGIVLPGLALAWGWRNAALTGAVLAVLVAAATPLLVPAHVAEDTRGRERRRRPERGSPLWTLRLYAFLMGAASGLINTYIVLFATREVGFSVAGAGLAAAAMGAVGIGARILWAHLGDRGFRVPQLLVTIAGTAVITSALLALAPAIGPLAVWVGAAGGGISITSWNALVMLAVINSSTLEAVGVSSGYVLQGFFVGLLVSPVLFGLTVDATGGFLWVWVGQGLLSAAALAAALSWMLRVRAARREAAIS